MIQVTFAYLMPDQPAHGTGFYLDGKYAGYLGQDANGDHFVYFYRPFWHNTRIREARGYVVVTNRSAGLSLVRRLVTRLAYRQLMSRTRAIVNSDCAKTFYLHVLESQSTRRGLSYALIDERTWNDPSRSNRNRHTAFPLARAACPVSLIPQASTPTRALFLPEAITRSLLNAHRSNAATTTTRNTQ
ncbi:hypothetical protein P3W43_14315 [Salinicola salarius]|uniref:hypothetical protein n=1 Tax=Salinicola salarius TaxID=430457 RepID=UPI0023E3BB13|nr:hypothetical protein [Salinicola salarius]MDF3920032.1 hypothetical protein [Salinicola salarius]